MRPLVLSGRATVPTLQQEIQRSEESRYDHRLHGVLLVAHGMTCPEVALLLGDAPRSVEYWVHRFREKGLGYMKENTLGDHVVWARNKWRGSIGCSAQDRATPECV
jgi:Homeodomain-like domain-containing protein